MIKIICVGKIKGKFYKEAVLEYVKRLSKYTRLEIIELQDFDYDIVKTINEEGKEILSKINDKDYVVTMEIEGKAINSIGFSKFVDVHLKDNLTFIIGGSNGLSEDVKKRRDTALSFSSLTFPHQLFRVILLEQVYRAFKIINNESYHK